jgi:hypothetical protein
MASGDGAKVKEGGKPLATGKLEPTMLGIHTLVRFYEVRP